MDWLGYTLGTQLGCSVWLLAGVEPYIINNNNTSAYSAFKNANFLLNFGIITKICSAHTHTHSQNIVYCCFLNSTNCRVVQKHMSMFTCVFEDSVCMCVAYASRHTILYQSSHLTAALVAPRQSADVTVIVWVCVCVLTKPSSFLVCKNIWTGPTRCSPACCDELLLYAAC